MSQKQNEQEFAEHVGVETRSRSRSKTPSRVVVVVKDVAKSPAVDTIIEESEPSSNRQVTSKKVKQSVVVSQEESLVSSEEVVSSTTTVVTSTARKVNRRLTQQPAPSPVKKSSRTQGSAKKSKEVTQNEENMLLETSIEAISQNSTTNGSPMMNFAYKEYKEAGEYWNKYPKTDYTYSELSEYRREIAPGQVGMPNMSRKSLELHHDRVVTMIQKRPEEESFIRKRYQSSMAPRKQLVTSLQYDSGDELDYNHFQKKTVMSSSLVQRETFVRRVWTLITTVFTTVIYYPVNMFKAANESESFYRTRMSYEEGLFTRITNRLSSVLLNVLKRVYLIVSTVLLFDTWLLISRTSVIRDVRRRRFLLLLLFLLPLLLLGGIFFRPLIMENFDIWYKHTRETLSETYNYVTTLDSVKIKSSLTLGLKNTQELIYKALNEFGNVAKRTNDYLHEKFISITSN